MTRARDLADGADKDIAGTLTLDDIVLSNDMSVADDGKVQFGAGNDLQIYHNGVASVINDAGTGDLYLGGDNNVLITSAALNEIKAQFVSNGAAELYHDNSKKFETSSTGVDITGGFTATDGCTITTADNSQQLSLISTDADANVGPELHLRRNSASPANNDAAGEISFNANNDAGQDTNIVSVDTRILTVADGNEEGGLEVRTMKAGSMRSRINMYGSTTVINDDSQDIDFRVESDNDANAFFVQGSSGNVGISTSSPEGLIGLPATASNTPKFRLQSASTNTDFAISSYADANGTYVSLGANHYLDSGGNDAVFETTDRSAYVLLDARNNGVVAFGTNSSGVAAERMRIDSNGRVSIGGTTVTDVNMLNIQGSGASNNIGVAFNDTNTSKIYGIQNGGSELRFHDYSASATRMLIDSSGKLVVGTSSGSGRLHVQEVANAHAAFIHNTNASFASSTLQVSTTRSTTNASYNHFNCSIHGVANKMAVRDSGAIVSTNNSVGSISDQRMKENIVDAASQWDDIKAVQVRKYNRIGETQKELGVIAQELEASNMGGLVDESEWFDVVANPNNEVRKSVKYSILYMKAVKALQEAMTRIETLETQRADLEARLTALEAAE